MEREIQRLSDVSAAAADFDGDGKDEIMVAVAYYKNHALYIVGDDGQKWSQVLLPTFNSRAEAEAYVRRHQGQRQRP